MEGEQPAEEEVNAVLVTEEVDAVLAAAEEMDDLELPSSDSEPEDVMDSIAEVFMTLTTSCESCGVSAVVCAAPSPAITSCPESGKVTRGLFGNLLRQCGKTEHAACLLMWTVALCHHLPEKKIDVNRIVGILSKYSCFLPFVTPAANIV